MSGRVMRDMRKKQIPLIPDSDEAALLRLARSSFRALHPRELATMCERIGRSLSDFDALPDHVRAMLSDELETHTLTHASLASAFDRHAEPIELPAYETLRRMATR